MFKGTPRERTLERVAHVANLGQHNLISTKRLTENVDAPMRVFSAAAIVCPHREPLVFRLLRPKTGLPEIKIRRSVTSKKAPANSAAAPSLMTARPRPQDVKDFHRLLCHPSEEIMHGTVRMAGAALRGT